MNLLKLNVQLLSHCRSCFLKKVEPEDKTRLFIQRTQPLSSECSHMHTHLEHEDWCRRSRGHIPFLCHRIYVVMKWKLKCAVGFLKTSSWNIFYVHLFKEKKKKFAGPAMWLLRIRASQWLCLSDILCSPVLYSSILTCPPLPLSFSVCGSLADVLLDGQCHGSRAVHSCQWSVCLLAVHSSCHSAAVLDATGTLRHHAQSPRVDTYGDVNVS